jgi:hypothetical protein
MVTKPEWHDAVEAAAAAAPPASPPPAPTPPEKNRKKAGGKFQKGRSGNPTGKRKGTRNRKTILVEKLLENIDVGAILAKIEKKAKAGDHAAAKLLLDRVVPVRRGYPIAIKLPPINTAADAVKANAVVIDAVSAGRLSTIEAQELSAVIDVQRKSIELLDVERRLAALEGRFK